MLDTETQSCETRYFIVHIDVRFKKFLWTVKGRFITEPKLISSRRYKTSSKNHQRELNPAVENTCVAYRENLPHETSSLFLLSGSVDSSWGSKSPQNFPFKLK